MTRPRKTTPAKGRARISQQHQVTIPAEVMEASGLQAGDVLELEVIGEGRLELRRTVNTYRAAAGTLTGVFTRGYLDRLRDEWNR